MDEVRLGVFLNGDWDGSFIPLTNTADHALDLDHVFMADGGIRHLPQDACGARLLTWVGDGDSLTPRDRQRLELLASEENRKTDRHSLNADKNESDFAELLKLIPASNAAPLIHLFGGLGGRADHQRANIAEAVDFLLQRESTGIMAFHSSLVVASSAIQIDLAPGQLFSITADRYPTAVRIKGARWEGEIELGRPSHGLSNEATGPVEIEPRRGVVVVTLNHS